MIDGKGLVAAQLLCFFLVFGGWFFWRIGPTISFSPFFRAPSFHFSSPDLPNHLQSIPILECFTGSGMGAFTVPDRFEKKKT